MENGAATAGELLFGCCCLLAMGVFMMAALAAGLSLIRDLLGVPGKEEMNQREQAMQQRIDELERRLQQFQDRRND